MSLDKHNKWVDFFPNKKKIESQNTILNFGTITASLEGTIRLAMLIPVLVQ